MADIMVGHTYQIDGSILRRTKVNDCGLCVFDVVDQNGNKVIIHDKNNPGVIVDHGVRIVFNRIDELIFIK